MRGVPSITPRRGAALLALVALLGGAVIWLQSRPAAAPKRSADPEARSTSVAFLEAPRRYRFSYESNEQTVFALAQSQTSPPIDAHARLEGELILAPLPADSEGPARYALRLASLTTREMTVLNQDALAGDAGDRLPGATVVIVRGEDGAVETLLMPRDLPKPTRQVLRLLALETAFTLRAGSRWTVREPSPHGTARSEYARESAARVTRRRTVFDRLTLPPHLPGKRTVDGRLELTLDDGGALRSLHGTERLDVSAKDNPHTPILRARTELSLALLSGAPRLLASDLSDYEDATDEQRASDALDRQDLEQRVAGLTIEQMTEAITTLGNAPQLPDHNSFLWRASGLLLKNPGAARALAPAFLDPVANSNRRKLVLDLLAQTNTPEAQAVLRELIESRAAAAEPKDRAEYIQRLAFVAEPDDVTVKLAQQRLRDPDTALPAAFATGSIARRRERMGDTDGAQALSAELVQAVETANDADRAKYVRALSNTKSTRHLPLYQRLAKANDAETRRAVVMAVASLDGQQSTEIILSSLDDADPRVQVTALRALSGRTPGRAELQRLLALVREGSIEQESFVPLERLLRVAAPSEGAAVRDVLLAMRDAGIQGADVRARVYALLDQID
jgi:hypothetical protein